MTEMEVVHQSLTIDAAALCEPADVARLAQDTPFGFFRRHNLLEFKSPNDLLNEAEYNLMIARALLYVAQEKASRSDALVCIFNPTKPVAMLRRLAGSVEFERVAEGHYVGKDAVTCHLFVASELPVEERYFPLLFLAKGRKKEEFLEELVRRWDTRLLDRYLVLHSDERETVMRMAKRLPTIEENYHKLILGLAQDMPKHFVQALKDLPADMRAEVLRALTEEPNGQPTKPKRSKRKRR
ncbi:MAG: hypothetical protein NZT92_13645 [Abditibacteriales bacterium]|nr:hypothetical protein [Abditibacteriales bacterium]MDW8367170.1 hypothetical protein [Abditibacteriales bacterium]